MNKQSEMDQILELLRILDASLLQLNNTALELSSYMRLQVDLLQQLIQNRNTNAERNMKVVVDAVQDNPILKKMGVTPEVMKDMLNKMGK